MDAREKFPGLWILNTESLLQLDEIFDGLDEKTPEHRTLNVTAEKNRRFRYTTFREALSDVAMTHLKPSEFVYTLYFKDKSNVEIELKDTWWERTLVVSVKGERFDDGKTFQSLIRWAESRRPPRIASIWSENWLYCIPLAAFLFWVVPDLSDTLSKSQLSAVKKVQANQLLENGHVGENNRDKAIEFLVRDAAGLIEIPHEIAVPRGTVLFWTVLTSLGLATFGIFRPHTVIGVGAGKGSSWWQQAKIDYVLKRFVPGVLLIPLAGMVWRLIVGWANGSP